MATKTISVGVEAYKRLQAAKRNPQESFTQVILRAKWPGQTVTGKELLGKLRRGEVQLEANVLDAIEAAKRADRPAPDKWRNKWRTR